MRLVLLSILFATSASAQTPDSSAATPRKPSAGVVIGGAAAGVAAVAGGRLVLDALGVPEGSRGAALLLYPVGAAAGVYHIERSRGCHGSLGATARGAARGTLLAMGGVLLIGYGVGQTFGQSGGASGGAAALGGLAIALVTPPYFAAAGYNASDVRPVVLVGPDGERTAGLALRVGL